MQETIVLEAKNVVYYCKANKGKKVLDDISYGFEIGKMYVHFGTKWLPVRQRFLSLLAGLDSPTDGEFIMKGKYKKKRTTQLSKEKYVIGFSEL